MDRNQAAIRRWLAEHSEEYLRDLADLVAVRSVRGDAQPGAPFGPECARALKVAAGIAEGHGFRVADHESYVLSADLGPEDRALDILAHLDVVGEGLGWDTDPYTLVRDGDMLYGRGVSDDKGPALAALYAMRAVKELGLDLKKGVRLILGSDEESGSQDIAYYYSKEKPAPGTFSPDCDFPVYNTEKGSYKPVFTMEYEKSGALPRVTRLDGGFRINVLPSDAEAELLGLSPDEVAPVLAAAAADTGVSLSAEAIPGGVRILSHGVQAHASLPELGNNGITALIEALCRLPLADCGSTRALHGLKAAFPHGDFRGRALGIEMEDEISGPITVAFSLLHLDETGVRGQFDGRVPLCADDENCRLVAEARFRALGFTPQGSMFPGHHTPAEGAFVSTLLRCYEDVTGEKGACLAMGGGTYVHDIPGGVAFGPNPAGFSNREHGANERGMLSAFLQAAEIYALAIVRLCGA